MNIKITDLDMILQHLDITSLEPHDDYTSEFTYKDQKILHKYITDLQQENKQLKEGLDETILRLKTCVLELMDIAKQDYYWIVSNKIERAKDEIISYKIMGNNDTKFFIDKGDSNEKNKNK